LESFAKSYFFFINEYWILIPSAILANYFIIRKIRLDKERDKELEKFIEQIEREKNQKNTVF
jgi:hypothetical protein